MLTQFISIFQGRWTKSTEEFYAKKIEKCEYVEIFVFRFQISSLNDAELSLQMDQNPLHQKLNQTYHKGRS